MLHNYETDRDRILTIWVRVCTTRNDSRNSYARLCIAWIESVRTVRLEWRFLVWGIKYSISLIKLCSFKIKRSYLSLLFFPCVVLYLCLSLHFAFIPSPCFLILPWYPTSPALDACTKLLQSTRCIKRIGDSQCQLSVDVDNWHWHYPSQLIALGLQ